MFKRALTAAVAVMAALLLVARLASAYTLYEVELDYTVDQEDAREMLSMINEFRRSDDTWYWNSDNTSKEWVSDLGELEYDYNLEQVAMQRAYEIALVFEHHRPDGSSFASISCNGVRSSGENIACGSGTKMDTPEEAFNSFLEEDKDYDGQGHRRNMLRSYWGAVGLAHVEVNGCHFWVQEFSTGVSEDNEPTDPVTGSFSTTLSANVDGTDLYAYIEPIRGKGPNYTGVLGQSYDLPAIHSMCSERPAKYRKQRVVSTGYEYIVGFLYGIPIETDDLEIEWETDDPDVCIVEDGRYKITGLGSATLTAHLSFNGSETTCTMGVTGTAAAISSPGIVLETEEYIYTGEEIIPEFELINNGIPMTEGVDYEVTGYSDNVEPGTGYVYVSALGDSYTGTASFPFEISKRPVGECTVTGLTDTVYDGTEHFQDPDVFYGDVLLEEGRDYTVTCTDNVDAGTAYVVISGIGDYYEGELSVGFEIAPKPMDPGSVFADIGEYVYDGTGKCPEVTVFDGDLELIPDRDYEVIYADNINAGDAQVTVNGLSNYCGTVTFDFEIYPRSITELDLPELPDVYYTEEVPDVALYDGAVRLVAGSDYLVSSDGVSAGKHDATVTGINNYCGSCAISYNVIPRPVTETEIRVLSGNVYSGEIQTPDISLYNGETLLREGTDYEILCSDNRDAGEARAVIYGRGNYSGSREMEFTIAPLPVTELTEALFTPCVYNGREQEPEIDMSFGDFTFSPEDYDISFSNNIDAGTALATVGFKGNFSGTFEIPFEIFPKDISECVIDEIPDQFYEGEDVIPVIDITCGDTYLIPGEDYDISLSGNDRMGVATAVITGRGNYGGTASADFFIAAQTTGLEASTVDSSTVLLTWDETPGADGYEVFRATSYTGTYTRLQTVYTNSRTCPMLSVGTRYYFMVRPFVLSGGNKIYGIDSSVIDHRTELKAPSGFTFSDRTSDSLRLSWNETVGADGYQVWTTDLSTGNNISIREITSCDTAFTGLTPSGNYSFKVRSFKVVSGSRVYSPYSVLINVPMLPSAAVLSAEPSSASSVMLSWTEVPGADGYQIWRSTSASGSYVCIGDQTGTAKNSTCLSLGTTYCYKVRAYRLVNGQKLFGSYSQVISCAPKVPSVTGLTATPATSSSAAIKWGKIEGQGTVIYEVWVTSPKGSTVCIGKYTGNSCTAKNLITGSAYTVRVRPYCILADGRRIYGEYTPSIKVTTHA